MPRDMKTIVHSKGILHVETPLGIVNIYVGLEDHSGRPVDAVEMIPDRMLHDCRVVAKVGQRFVLRKTRKGPRARQG